MRKLLPILAFLCILSALAGAQAASSGPGPTLSAGTTPLLPLQRSTMTAQQGALLGLVEGITEFLPVSSTGHLLIVQNLLGLLSSPEEKDASLKYVFTNQLVDAITVGMLTPDEVDDTLKRMSAVKA